MNTQFKVMNTYFKKSWIFLTSLFFMAHVGFTLPTNIAMGKVYLPGSIRNFNNPGNAFDGNVATIASGGTDANTGGALAVDFGSSKNLLSISITFGEKFRAAQWYKIQVSENGNDWTDILRVHQAQSPTDSRALPAGSHRYLRYVSGNCNAPSGDGETSGSLVSVAEIAVFERGSMDPVGSPAPIYPAPLDRTGWKLKLIGGGQLDGVIDGKDQGWCDPHGVFSEGDALIKDNLGEGNGLEVDMGAAKDFNQIWYANGHAPMFTAKVEVSNDGTNWDSIWSGPMMDRGKLLAPVNFPMQHKRYFKLVSTSGCSGCWWGVNSIAALNSLGSSVEDTGGSVNIALHKTASGFANANLLFDGDEKTTAAGQVKVDLGEVTNVRRIILRYTSRHDGYFMPIAISKDNVVWDTVSWINVDWPPQFLAMANYSTRYLKFDFPSLRTGYDNLSEIEIFKSDPNSVGINSKKFFPSALKLKTTDNNSRFIANGKKVKIEAKNNNLLPFYK